MRYGIRWVAPLLALATWGLFASAAEGASGGRTSGRWRLYFRITLTDGGGTNIALPRKSSMEPVEIVVPTRILANVQDGESYKRQKVQEVLGADGYREFVRALNAYMRAHPDVHPKFRAVDSIRLMTLESRGAASGAAGGGETTTERPSSGGGTTTSGGGRTGRTGTSAASSGGREPYEGYGVNRGGSSGKEVVVTNWSQLSSALGRSNVNIKVRGDIIAGKDIRSRGSNLTLDGGGKATIWGKPGAHFGRMLEFYGNNLIIQNIRIRNSGDNIGFKAPANKIMIHHMTTSGSDDDGLSLAYGTKNVTVQYSAFFGCTRSLFIKYDNPSNISLHHSFFRCQQMRGPKVTAGINVDVRNIVQEDYSTRGWGSRFESGSTGNVINSTFVLTGATKGRSHAALYIKGKPKVYFNGNVGRGGCKPEVHGSREIPCARVTTHSAAEGERIVRARAGCMPRDAIDKAYISARKWTVSESTPFIIKTGPGR